MPVAVHGGVGGSDSAGSGRFAHTVFVDMRARFAASTDPRRIFKVTLEAASAAGLVGARRVLDSTPLYDAVATMDTVTLIRSAVHGLLRVTDSESPPSFVRRSAAATTTSRTPSRRTTGTTPKPVRRWSTRGPVTPMGVCGCWRAASWMARPPRPPRCWRPSSAKTWKMQRMACFASPAGWPPTG